MSVYLLDTDTLSLSQHAHPTVTAQISAHLTHTIGLTIVTVEEQVSGRLAVLRQVKSPADMVIASELLGATVISLAGFPLDYHTINSLALFDQLVQSKLNVRKSDLRIASIVLDAGGILVTRNRRDFARVPGLLVEDWSI
jgi:tRNA(fMet)-specific endonuclease VapC